MPQLDSKALILADSHLQHLLTLLKQTIPTFEVWAYGSRVTGKCHAASDLDLVVRSPTALNEPCSGLGHLRSVLQKSTLPLLVDVHDWATLSDEFRASIEAAYVRLQ